MDPEPFRSIPVVNHDLLMVYDYRTVEPSAIIKKVEKYAYLDLVAWSMGVWIAGKYFTTYKDRFSSAIAINGTLEPIDNRCGIPVSAFKGMAEEFSPAILEQFYRDMFDQPEKAARFLNSRPERHLESIAAELHTLQQKYEEHGPGDDIFTRKIVGSRDKVFQARSQLRSWGKEHCVRIKASHFPFYDYSSWDGLINGD